MVLRVVRMACVLWIVSPSLKFKWSIRPIKMFLYENLVGDQILYFFEFFYYFLRYLENDSF
jgi:hypothetical protein